MVFYTSRGNHTVTSTEITDALNTGTDNAYDIGGTSNRTRFIYNKSGVAIYEGYATGFRPSQTTDCGILFCVPTAGGKTQLRVGFQTGGSVVIAEEP